MPLARLARSGTCLPTRPGLRRSPWMSSPRWARRIYSNAGFEMLAEAVEAATSMSFAAYLNEAVIEPLGMSASELVGSPAAGARSTVADLHRFVAELQRPRLLAEQTVREATSVAFPGLSGVLPGYGRQGSERLGARLRDPRRQVTALDGSRSSPATYGHFGRGGTFVWVDPDVQCACVCLTDLAFGEWAVEAWPG